MKCEVTINRMEAVEELVRGGKFAEASQLCQDLELRLGSFQHWVKFHCLYMASLLAVRSFEEARYLWLRAPSQIKDSEFAAVWNVAEKLWMHDIKAAQFAANATTFSSPMAAVIEHVMECLRVEEVRALYIYIYTLFFAYPLPYAPCYVCPHA